MNSIESSIVYRCLQLVPLDSDSYMTQFVANLVWPAVSYIYIQYMDCITLVFNSSSGRKYLPGSPDQSADFKSIQIHLRSDSAKGLKRWMIATPIGGLHKALINHIQLLDVLQLTFIAKFIGWAVEVAGSGTFDWLDSFLEENPKYIELSDRLQAHNEHPRTCMGLR